MLRLLALAAIVLVSTAATPPPPSVLAPYIKDGRFDPGDYGWMRGAFADATPAQKAEWRAQFTWRQQCRTDRVAAIRDELTRRGVTLTTQDVGKAEGVCGSAAYAMPHGDQGDNWPTFQAAVARARPIAQAIVWSAALAQVIDDARTPDEAALLIARPMTDQVLRQALSWDGGEIRGAPPLDPSARGVAEGLIWLAIAERDHANTAWLKREVAAHGWPTIAMVGKTASDNAWLLVQHADDDPIFQYDMLRLMEQLAAHGAIAKRNYALLYDRVMLKLAGKQRYASQMTCKGGRHVPLPLEDEARVDERRREMAMETMAENTARIDKMYGPCPADVILASPATR